MQYYPYTSSTGATHVLFQLAPGNGDADLYVRKLRPVPDPLPRPGFGFYDYASTNGSTTWLRRAARLGRLPFTLAFAWASARNPRGARYPSIVLYRTLGPTLPKGMEPAASLWGVAQMYVRNQPRVAARAGFGGSPLKAGNRLFDAILANPSGLIFAVSECADSWNAVGLPGHRINLFLPELMPELERIDREPLPRDTDYPFILSAGERRAETTNTLVRDTGWHRKGVYGALRLNPSDAAALGCGNGDMLRLSTRRGSVLVTAEVSPTMQPGHVSLPNGQGLDYRAADGNVVRAGVAPNELTDVARRDFLAGTPCASSNPARSGYARPSGGGRSSVFGEHAA